MFSAVSQEITLRVLHTGNEVTTCLTGAPSVGSFDLSSLDICRIASPRESATRIAVVATARGFECSSWAPGWQQTLLVLDETDALLTHDASLTLQRRRSWATPQSCGSALVVRALVWAALETCRLGAPGVKCPVKISASGWQIQAHSYLWRVSKPSLVLAVPRVGRSCRISGLACPSPSCHLGDLKADSLMLFGPLDFPRRWNLSGSCR